jgi:hypothetical protein
VVLAVLAVGQALVFIPVLRELARREKPPAVADVNLPEQVVRVFRSPGELRLILKSPLDLPEADDERARVLDEALFPGGDRHRYFLLHAVNSGEARQKLRLPLVIEDSEGRAWPSVDLFGPLVSRSEHLPDYLRFYLRVRVPAPGDLHLPPDSARDVLVAVPIRLDPDKMAKAVVDGRTLSPAEIRKDELDGILEQNRGAIR